MTNNHTLLNSAFGIAATTGGLVTSFQQQLEWWFRMTSLTIGIIIGSVALYNLITKKKP